MRIRAVEPLKKIPGASKWSLQSTERMLNTDVMGQTGQDASSVICTPTEWGETEAEHQVEQIIRIRICSLFFRHLNPKPRSSMKKIKLFNCQKLQLLEKKTSNFFHFLKKWTKNYYNFEFKSKLKENFD